MCSELGWTPDSTKLESMKAANEKELAKLDASVKDAEENLGDIEVRDSHLAKAEYLYKIGESHHPAQPAAVMHQLRSALTARLLEERGCMCLSKNACCRTFGWHRPLLHCMSGGYVKQALHNR